MAISIISEKRKGGVISEAAKMATAAMAYRKHEKWRRMA